MKSLIKETTTNWDSPVWHKNLQTKFDYKLSIVLDYEATINPLAKIWRFSLASIHVPLFLYCNRDPGIETRWQKKVVGMPGKITILSAKITLWLWRNATQSAIFMKRVSTLASYSENVRSNFKKVSRNFYK